MNAKNATTLPFNLYKVNLGLQARIIKLVQTNSQQWLDIGYHAAKDGLAESTAEIEQILKAGDWQKLAALPAESFGRLSQKNVAEGQALAKTLFDSQTAFAEGLQDAVKTWQKETAGLFGESPVAAPFVNAEWADLFKPWEQALSGFGFTTGSTKAAPAKDAK